MLGRLVEAIEMALARGASDHQSAQPEETWPDATDESGQCGDSLREAGKQILIDDQEGLDRTDLTVLVDNGEVTVIEVLMNGIFDQLVEPPILPVAGEGGFPKAAAHEFRAPQHLHVTALKYFAVTRFDRTGLAPRRIEIDPRLGEFFRVVGGGVQVRHDSALQPDACPPARFIARPQGRATSAVYRRP
jgi:hypothetical protein